MGKPEHSLDGVNLGVVETYEDLQLFMTWLGERRPVLAMDTETTGLDAWASDARIRLCQFGDAMTGWTVPWHLWPGLVNETLRRYTGRVTWHNIAYDAKYMAVNAPEFVLPWHRMDDTMIMARMAEPYQSAALKRLTSQLFDSRADIGSKALKQAMDDNGWTWGSVPLDFDTYTMYGALDTVLGARLWEHFQPWLNADQNRWNYELEMEVRRICTKMELKGMRVDLEYCEKQYVQLAEYAESIVTWASDAFGIANVGSDKQLVEWVIAQGAGDFCTKRTRGGAMSMDKEVLTKLTIEPDVPENVKLLAGQVLKARKAEKLAGTYFKNFIGFNRDGILHPDINPLAARTSRMSITNPALQTLNKGEATVRDAFIPHSEDELLVTCDSDQIEARLFANFSRDKNFQAAFGGGDFFVNLARRIYEDPTLQKSDPRRPTIKTYMYSKLYGAGVPKMALSAKVPERVMREVDNQMNVNYPGIKSFQSAVTTAAMNEGYVRTPLGRQLMIEDRSKAYVATNYTLQGHAAELLKLSLVSMDNSGIGDFLMVPVHDEVVASVPKDIAEDVARTMEQCMTFTDPELYPVPITASAEGPFTRWGDKIREGK